MRKSKGLILYKQRVSFSDKYCWSNFTRSLGLLLPWINKASRTLYTARIIWMFSMPCHDWSEVQRLSCVVEFVSVIEASKLVTIEVESRSHTPSLWLRRRHGCRLCTHYIDDLVPHPPLQVCSYWGYGQEVFHIITRVLHVVCPYFWNEVMKDDCEPLLNLPPS
jgi:hypothetical protein